MATPASSNEASYTHRKGVAPNTLSVISTKAKLYAIAAGGDAATQVGVVASFDPSETRTIEPVRGIGFGDQIAELVPGVTEPMSLSVTRTAQYLSFMYQAFGYNGGVDGLVRSLKHHRWPFDIRQEIVFSDMIVDEALATTANVSTPDDATEMSGAQALVTIFEGCWFSDWGTNFASDSALVQENCTIMVSDVHNSTMSAIGSYNADTGKTASMRSASDASGATATP